MDTNIIEFPKNNHMSELHLPYNLIAIQAAKKLKLQFDKESKMWLAPKVLSNQVSFLEDIFNSTPTEIEFYLDNGNKWIVRRPVFNVAFSLFGVPLVSVNKTTGAPYFNEDEVNMSAETELKIFNSGCIGISSGVSAVMLVPSKLLSIIHNGALNEYPLLQNKSIHSELMPQEIKILW